MRASEIPFDIWAEAAADGIVLVDDQGAIWFVNPAAGRIFGYEPAEMVGKHLTGLIPEHLREAYLTSLKGYLATGQRRIPRQSVEVTGLHQSGREFPVEVSFTEHTSEGRRFFIGIVRDVTDGKRAEAALRASEQRFRDILDNATAVIFVKDLELRYVLANREYERRFEMQRDQIRGKTDFDLYPRAVAEALGANDWHVINTGVPVQFEAVVPLPKEERVYLVEKFLLRDSTQKPYALSGVATDVTTQRRTKELQATRARYAALHADIHAAFASRTHGGLRSILQASAEAVVRHFDAAFARIWTLNDQENLLELQASAGQYTRLDGEFARIRVGEAHVGLIAQERRPYLTNDLLNDLRTEHREWASQERITALAGQPLLVEGRLVGALAMFARHPLGPDALQALASVADIVAQGAERKQAEEALQHANEQLHVLSGRLFQIQEDERRHLARELHDHIGQALTAAKIDLQAAQGSVAGTALGGRLNEGVGRLEHLLQQVRQLSIELRPPLLDDLGLVPALRSYLDQQAQRAGFRAEFVADPALGRVEPELETACFRVAQEALTNVVRHARARTVRVELHRAPEALHLLVRDDGIGFELAGAQGRAERGESLGLMGMRERVALLGGELDVRSEPGHGTEVHAFFPVAPRAAAQEEPRP